jgi:hypothetical protein
MVAEATKKVLGVIVSFGGTAGLAVWAERMSALLKEHASGENLEIAMAEGS